MFALHLLTDFKICNPPPPPPKELGGVYYSTNVILSQSGCWVAAALYSSYYFGTTTRTNDDGTTTVHFVKFDDATIYSVLGALFGTWLLSVFLFFLKIKRKYWATFYSMRTGCQHAMLVFLENGNDASAEWTLANWHKWERKKERPAWFTDAFKESVPNHLIPKVALEELNKKAGGGETAEQRICALPSTKQEGESGAGASGHK